MSNVSGQAFAEQPPDEQTLLTCAIQVQTHWEKCMGVHRLLLHTTQKQARIT